MVGIPSECLVYLVINTPNKTIIFKRVDSTTLEKLIIQRKISKKLSKIFLNKVYGWKTTHADLQGFRENPEKTFMDNEARFYKVYQAFKVYLLI